MAIPIGIQDTAPSQALVPRKKFTLSALSDTDGIIDPQSGKATTARALRVNVAGTLATVDTSGNSVAEVVAAGDLILGLCNGVKSTGTVTITASDVTVYL